MLWVYDHYKYFTLTARGSFLDVRRQILRSEVDPRAARVRPYVNSWEARSPTGQ